MHRTNEDSREGNGGRALAYQAGFTGDLTIRKCIQSCTDAGYTMAGAEYANECCKLSDSRFGSDD